MAYKQYQIFGPYGGLVDIMPATTKQPNQWDDCQNLLSRKGRLISRPAFPTHPAGPPPDGAPLQLGVTFDDVVTNLHTLLLTTRNAYFLTNPNTYNQLTVPGSIGGVGDLSGTGLPYSYGILNNQVYFANGSVKVLYADGESSLKAAGDVPGSAYYMAVFGDHLLLANCIEPAPMIAGSLPYTRRVRWSAVGDPTKWTGDFTAGFADLLDLPGPITGFTSNGRNGYVFTRNGIEIAYATGNGLSPFAFEPFSNNPKGIGNAYPYSLDSYGNVAAFIGEADIYTFSGSDITQIGSKAKKAIFADLEASSNGVVTGTIIPQFDPGVDALAYWLSIPPLANWIYLFDDESWQRISMPNGGWSTFVGTVATS